MKHLPLLLACAALTPASSVLPPGASVSYSLSDATTAVTIDLPTWLTTDGLHFATCENPFNPCYGDTDLEAPNGATALSRQGSALGIETPTLGITGGLGQTILLGIETPNDIEVAAFALDDVDTFGSYSSSGLVLTVTDPPVQTSGTPEPGTLALLGLGSLLVGVFRRRRLNRTGE